jgi:hypothetical protein
MEITNVLALVVLAFASYRVTRFLVIDSLIENIRARFQTFLFNKDGKLKLIWHKLLDLISCTWCTGFWVSLVLYSVFVWTSPHEFTRVDWISAFAVAGLQGLLHSWEPDDA